MDLKPLDEGILFDHEFKLVNINVEVIDTMLLPFTHLSRCVRDTESKFVWIFSC